MSSAWGGGMYSEDTCGIVISATASFGKLFASDKVPYTNDKLKNLITLWIEKWAKILDQFHAKN